MSSDSAADDRLTSSREHVAEPGVAGGGHELIAGRDSHHAPHFHRPARFRWTIAGLFVLAACALAAALALSATGSRSRSGSGGWSTWSPSESGLAGAQEIADYVAPYYRATPSDQLAVVTAVNLNNPANPLQVVVPTSGSSGSSGSVLPLPASSTVVYNMCGVGSTDCSIAAGTPSSARLLLLRREALELAMYTFKYIGGINTVVAILPPGHTLQTACTGICAKPQSKAVVKPLDLAVAFDRKELQQWLNHPLRATLPEQLPPTVGEMASAPEAELVSIITAHGLFAEHTAQAQDGSTVMSLSPMPPQ
jgi:hypothetical protein